MNYLQLKRLLDIQIILMTIKAVLLPKEVKH